MAKGRGGRTPSSPSEAKAIDTLDIPVKFGGFSAGDETCRLGLIIERDQLNTKLAEKFLVGAQLEVKMGSDPNSNGDTPGQDKFWQDTEVVAAVGDAHHITLGPNRITTGLTFKLGSVTASDILSLSKRVGRIKAVRLGDAEQPKRGRPSKGDEDDDDQQEMDGE